MVLDVPIDIEGIEFAALKRKVVELHTTWRSRAVLVEDAASGQSLIQELRSGTTLPLKPIKPDRDKYERLTAITPVLEARRLRGRNLSGLLRLEARVRSIGAPTVPGGSREIDGP